MKSNPSSNYLKKLFLLAVCFMRVAVPIDAQTVTKPKPPRTFIVPKLQISFQLDTTGNSSFELSDNMATILFTKDYYIQFFIYDAFSTQKKIREEFRSDEFIQTLDGENELKLFSDSSTLKINSASFWKVRESWRPIPRYWVDMKDKKKLTSQQMTEYLKSDKESWNKSNNAIVYYGAHPKTKKMFLIQAGFRNGGELPPTLEDQLKKLVTSIKYL